MITYIATNTLNGKFYIGSTTNFPKRKNNHLYCKVKSHFHHALRKDPELFEWEIFEDSDDKPTLEQALLDMWFGKEQCYNLNPLASRPPSHKGFKRRPESVRKSAEKRKGVKRTPEQCKRISEGLTGRELTATQLVSAKKNCEKANKERQRKVELTNTQTGEVYTFDSISDAEKIMGFGNIGRACREVQRTVKGFRAKYL